MSRIAAAFWAAALLATASAQEARAVFGFRHDHLWLTRASGPLPTFSTGPSAGFDNPAYLAGDQGHEFKVMGLNLTHPVSVAAAYVGHFGPAAAFGVAENFSNSAGRRENVAVISAASSGKGIDFGANLKTLWTDGWPAANYDSALFAMDADVGAAVTLRKRLTLGAALFNLICPTLVETEHRKLSPERSAKVSAGLLLGRKPWAALFTEVRWDSLHGGRPAGLGSGGGLQGRWDFQGILEARLGYLRYDRGPSPVNSGLLGLSYWPALGLHRAGIEYGLRVDVSSGHSAAQSHFLLLGYHLGGEGDFTPPEAQAGSDAQELTPDGDGLNDKVNFLLSAQDDPQGRGVKTWALVVYRKDRGRKLSLVKSYSGTGLPPRAIEWDGRDTRREVVPAGTYYFELRVVDFSGNEGRSGAQILHVE